MMERLSSPGRRDTLSGCFISSGPFLLTISGTDGAEGRGISCTLLQQEGEEEKEEEEGKRVQGISNVSFFRI